ncbi:hypothetical protein [Nonomuraea sp. NPDC049141]
MTRLRHALQTHLDALDSGDVVKADLTRDADLHVRLVDVITSGDEDQIVA